MPNAIRPSEPEDGELLVQIWRSSVAATHSFVSPADLVAIDVEVQQLLPGSPLWVALDESRQPVGFMGLTDHSVDSLFVAGERRCRGVGRELLHFAMEGCSHLTTVVNEQNDQAIGFYRRMGFIVIGRSPDDESGRPYPVLHMRWDR
jgi:putative acetyltransferase